MKQAKHLLFAFLLITTVSLQAQVGIGTATPAASAQLDVSSTTKGFLPPRMSAAQRAAIATPAEGLLVYQTNGSKGYYYFISGAWTSLTDEKTYTSLTIRYLYKPVHPVG